MERLCRFFLLINERRRKSNQVDDPIDSYRSTICRSHFLFYWLWKKNR